MYCTREHSIDDRLSSDTEQGVRLLSPALTASMVVLLLLFIIIVTAFCFVGSHNCCRPTDRQPQPIRRPRQTQNEDSGSGLQPSPTTARSGRATNRAIAIGANVPASRGNARSNDTQVAGPRQWGGRRTESVDSMITIIGPSQPERALPKHFVSSGEQPEGLDSIRVHSAL